MIVILGLSMYNAYYSMFTVLMLVSVGVVVAVESVFKPSLSAMGILV